MKYVILVTLRSAHRRYFYDLFTCGDYLLQIFRQKQTFSSLVRSLTAYAAFYVSAFLLFGPADSCVSEWMKIANEPSPSLQMTTSEQVKSLRDLRPSPS